MTLKQLFGIAALGLLATTASAAGNVQGQKYGDWGGQCETTPQQERVCYLLQTLSDKKTNELIMATAVGYGKDKNFPTAIFDLPKTVDIQKGVQLKVDRYPAVSFKGACDGKGCRAGFTLDNPLTQQFSKGKQAVIAYRIRGQQEPVFRPVSLRGMAQGLAALRR